MKNKYLDRKDMECNKGVFELGLRVVKLFIGPERDTGKILYLYRH